MFKIELQPNNKYRILCYVPINSTPKPWKLYELNSFTLYKAIEELAHLLKCSETESLEDEIRTVLVDSGQTSVYISDEGKILIQPAN